MANTACNSSVQMERLHRIAFNFEEDRYYSFDLVVILHDER